MSIDYSKYNAHREEDQGPELSRLLDQLEEAQQKEEEAEEHYKRLKKLRMQLETKTIPETCAEMGLGDTVQLADGRTINCTSQVYVQIPKEDEPRAKQWLRDNGYGAMIKVEEKETISRSGLRPMAEDLPPELFRLNVVRKVKVK